MSKLLYYLFFCSLKAILLLFCWFCKLRKKGGQQCLRTSPRDSCPQIYIIKIKKRTFSPIMLLYENSQQRNPEKGQNRAQWAKSKNFFSKRGFKTLLNKTIFIFFAQKHLNNRKEYFYRRKCLKNIFWSQKIKKFKKKASYFFHIFFYCRV